MPEKRKQGVARLIEISGTKRGYLTAAGILGVLGTVARMLIYVFMYLILLELVHSGGATAKIEPGTIYRCALWAGLSLAASLVFMSAGSISSHVAAFNLLYELRVRLSRKLSRLPMGYFNGNTSGGIKKVLAEDVERLEHFVAHHVVDFISAVAAPLLTLVFMFIVDWRMALAAFVSIPIAILTGRRVFATDSALQSNYQDALGRMNGSAVEYVRGMPVIKVFGRTDAVFAKLKKDVEGMFEAANAWADDVKTPYLLFNTLLTGSILFIFPLGTYLISAAPSFEAFLVVLLFFFVIGTNFAEPMKKLMLLTGVLGQVSQGMKRVDDILYEPEIEEPGTPLSPCDASVEFRNVRFSYGETETLKNVSLLCEPNTVTALVGPSGAGKSTIAQLMARFWDVNGGEIFIGGVNIKQMSNETLMDHVSFVFQDVVMLFDTIENNIRMGNKTASFEQVQNAAKAAQIHDFIELLPDKYQTLVGEGGIYLSGGEQQRISIARVILKDTPIVILDEATAYADAENEALIQQAFSELARNKTVVVVAHRLSTIVESDNIMVVSGGEIAESGTHEELLARSGLYAAMWQAHCSSDSWKLSVSERGNDV